MTFKRTKDSISKIKDGVRNIIDGYRKTAMGLFSLPGSLAKDIISTGVESIVRVLGYGIDMYDHVKDKFTRYIGGLGLQLVETKDRVINYARGLVATNSAFSDIADAMRTYGKLVGVDYYDLETEKGKNHVVVTATLRGKTPISPLIADSIANKMGLKNKTVLQDGRVMYHNDKMSMIVDPKDQYTIKVRSWRMWKAG